MYILKFFYIYEKMIQDFFLFVGSRHKIKSKKTPVFKASQTIIMSRHDKSKWAGQKAEKYAKDCKRKIARENKVAAAIGSDLPIELDDDEHMVLRKHKITRENKALITPKYITKISYNDDLTRKYIKTYYENGHYLFTQTHCMFYSAFSEKKIACRRDWAFERRKAIISRMLRENSE